jgi:hypothetical protein
MNVGYLIDSLVRHTTVLIAQVATSAGARAPLAHVVNRVFLDLVTEIERQGVARKVVADMFGLALRSYQQKVQRLSESVTDADTTLWEAVYAFLREKNVATRGDVLRRFRNDDEASLKSILHDLVESGLIYRAGNSASAVFRVATEEELGLAWQEEHERGVRAAVWFRVYREGPIAREALAQGWRFEAPAVSKAIDELLSDGHISMNQTGASESLRATRCFVPMQDTAAWGASVVDHFQMVTSAICAKLANRQTRALPDDEIGGSSYSFNVWPNHPFESRVRGLLRRTRTEVSELWDEVSRHNQGHELAQLELTKVNFYFGQGLSSALESTPNATPQQEAP